MIDFQQPWGFLALLSLPALLLVYRFVRQPVQHWITTSFLLPTRSRQHPEGRTWHRLRLPPSFWASALALLALTMALAQPLWRHSQDRPTIHLLLDGSFSMAGFRAEILATVRQLGASAHSDVQWVVIDSAQPQIPLLQTTDVASLLDRLERWLPSRGAHDLAEVLVRCRTDSASPSPESWIVVSDRPGAGTTADTHWISVGHPLPNAGFAGSLCEPDAEGWRWRAYVRNYSQQPLSREFSLEAGDRMETNSLLLQPGQIRVLEGRLPADCPRAILRLEPDAFFLDDALPLAPATACPLAVSLPSPGASAWSRLLQSIPHAREAERTSAQVAIGELPAAKSGLWLAETPLAGAVLFFQPSAETTNWIAQPVAAGHPWMNRLNWSALLAQPSGELADWLAKEAPGEVLLWSPEPKPLIATATRGGTKLLLIDFPAAHSNALSLPAFVLLINRFMEEVRAGLSCPRLAALSLGEAWPVGAPPARFQPAQPEAARPFSMRESRPLLPGFFLPDSTSAVTNPETPLAVVQFTDLAEADLQNCQPTPLPKMEEILRPATVATSRTAGHLMPWILAAMILQTLAWFFLSKEGA